MAEPRFCTVKKIIRCALESIRDVVRPKMSHGKRESMDATTKYGILFLPRIGIQSDKILHDRYAFKFNKTTTIIRRQNKVQMEKKA